MWFGVQGGGGGGVGLLMVSRCNLKYHTMISVISMQCALILNLKLHV